MQEDIVKKKAPALGCVSIDSSRNSRAIIGFQTCFSSPRRLSCCGVWSGRCVDVVSGVTPTPPDGPSVVGKMSLRERPNWKDSRYTYKFLIALTNRTWDGPANQSTKTSGPCLKSQDAESVSEQQGTRIVSQTPHPFSTSRWSPGIVDPLRDQWSIINELSLSPRRGPAWSVVLRGAAR